jgi:hypothetical protein
MGWVHELAHSAGVHTCHSTLYNRHPPSHHGHIQAFITRGGLRKVMGTISDIASTEAQTFLQAPPLPVLPLCTEALGITLSH